MAEDLNSVNHSIYKIPVLWVDVNGREEHEAIILDPEKCRELGLDQQYEIAIYLKRWGGWLH